MEDLLKFYKKLKKLIEKECPKNCSVVYDELQTSLFVITSDSSINDNEGNKCISYCGCPTQSKRTSPKTGYSKESVVGEGIFVELQAVQF